MLRRTLFGIPLAGLPLFAAGGEQRVFTFGDGVPLAPDEYAKFFAASVAPDDYSRGGVVEELELKMAALLGKEAAVWMPTGTLANHMAVRLLSSSGRRVAVQAESHLYNDCGDCSQTLSSLTLLPLAPGRATYTAAELEQAANTSMLGRVATPLAALQIETPVRRRRGERFDFGEMARISAWARSRKVGLHLDGARLFLESAYTGRPVREYAALFDTVYVSMYKYFNAASGAVLAGPKALLENAYHTRRMFGGGLHQAWPFAAVALAFLEGFEARFRKAVEISEQVIAGLNADGNFDIERIPNGTNIFRLRVQNVNGPIYKGRLEAAGISAPVPAEGWFAMQVNETWARATASEILARFRKAIS